ncbi:MAG TPA: hypothetical protein GXX35_11495 [Thermoanaerobacterales bacterium]|nr:hypothetical protein [Thermoanaerobacterales bacterium]
MSDLYIDTKELKQITIELNKLPKQIPQATAAALNRTLDFTATRIKKEVTAEYSVKSSDVSKTLKKKRASRSNLYAYIESKGHTLSLARFPHSPRKYSKRAKAVKVKVKKSGGYKTVNTQPKAFVQTMNNATNIWKREGPGRHPVTMLRTLSIPQMISNEGTMKKIQDAAAKKLQERVNHEIKWRLDKAASKKGGG